MPDHLSIIYLNAGFTISPALFKNFFFVFPIDFSSYFTEFKLSSPISN